MTIEVPDWAGYELLVMRVLFSWVLLTKATAWDRPEVSRLSHPVGLARVMPIAWITGRRIRRPSQWALVLAVVLYVLDWFALLALVVMCGLHVLHRTVEISRGAVNHGFNLLGVVLLAQTAAVFLWTVADVFDFDLDAVLLDSSTRTATWWTVQAVAAAYFTSGFVKLARSSMLWIDRSPKLVLAAMARADMAAVSSGLEARARVRTIADWMGKHRTAAKITFGSGLLLELAAPLSLFNRWTLLVGGLALIALHRSIGVVLLLSFPLYQWILFIFFVNPGYLIGEPLKALFAA